MRMDKLTSRFQQALADAQSLAVGRDNSIIEPVHLFSALLDQQGGSTRPLLAQAGVNVPVLRERLTEALDALPKVSGQAGNVSMGNDLGRLLNQTDKLAQQHGDAFIASEWFVLAALDDGGTLGMALRAAGADKTRLQAAIDKSQENVSGTVKVKLYKGNVSVIGRESPNSLYDQDLVTFEDGVQAYDHKDAAGFIKLNALRLRVLAKRDTRKS